jgi:phospholipid-binding lipoprotein MlaA
MKFVLRIMVLASVLSLVGCATNNPKDPLEKFNRVMFDFNDVVDRTALKPAAQVYVELPSFVQTGVSNFFGNLVDPWIAINNVLQGKVEEGLSDMMRFLFNSTFGLAGVFDIGSEAGLPKHSEDFGQTLGKWGVKSGPYVVLPLFGSSTVRDAAALPLDFKADLWWYAASPVSVRNSGVALRAVDQRASVLDASTLIEEAALDRYVFVRDAYLQRRQSKVYDGEPPESSSYEDDVGPTGGYGGAAEASNVADVKAGAEPAATPIVNMEPTGAGNTQSGASATKPQQ